MLKSLPTRGAWIEINLAKLNLLQYRSLPTRGAWIEMSISIHPDRAAGSLPTRGAWIEILSYPHVRLSKKSRSPHGERGLK